MPNAAIILTPKEGRLVDRAIRYIAKSYPFANEDFTEEEIDILEFVAYDIRKQVK